MGVDIRIRKIDADIHAELKIEAIREKITLDALLKKILAEHVSKKK